MTDALKGMLDVKFVVMGGQFKSRLLCTSWMNVKVMSHTIFFALTVCMCGSLDYSDLRLGTNLDCTLEDVLIFFTGADTIPWKSA